MRAILKVLVSGLILSWVGHALAFRKMWRITEVHYPGRGAYRLNGDLPEPRHSLNRTRPSLCVPIRLLNRLITQLRSLWSGLRASFSPCPLHERAPFHVSSFSFFFLLSIFGKGADLLEIYAHGRSFVQESEVCWGSYLPVFPSSLAMFNNLWPIKDFSSDALESEIDKNIDELGALDFSFLFSFSFVFAFAFAFSLNEWSEWSGEAIFKR